MIRVLRLFKTDGFIKGDYTLGINLLDRIMSIYQIYEIVIKMLTVAISLDHTSTASSFLDHC